MPRPRSAAAPSPPTIAPLPSNPSTTTRTSSNLMPATDSPSSRQLPGAGTVSSPEQSPTSDIQPHPGAIPRIDTPRSEGYPSWLPRRPGPPPPQSTIQSSDRREYLQSGLDMDADLGPERLSSELAQLAAGERRPTSRSVRIVSVPASQAASDVTHSDQPPPAGSGGLAPPPRHSPGAARAYSRSTSAALMSQMHPGPVMTPRPQPPRFKTRGLNLNILRNPSWLTYFRFYTLPLLVFAHIPLQTFFDFNVVYILLQVSKHPNFVAPGIPGSGRNWALALVAYFACFFIWFFAVFIVYELIYSFYRRWRVKHPLILPIYLSSPAFNLVSMTSYNNFCFLQHIRLSAFQSKHSGSLKDGLAETFYFYSQNGPTVALLLPRAALSLSLLLAFSSAQPSTLAVTNQGTQYRDATFFRSSDGTLTSYAMGILITNCAWTFWRTLVLLVSWFGLWYFSGLSCAGLCGPRYRWEEDENEKQVDHDGYPDGDSDLPEKLSWKWRECTRLRVQDAYEFCLNHRPDSRNSWTRSANGASTRRDIRGGEMSETKPLALGTSSVTPTFPIMDDPTLLAQVPPVFTQPSTARRGVLTSDLYTSPAPIPEGLSLAPSVTLPSPPNDSGAEPPLITLPYPLLPAAIPAGIPMGSYRAGMLPFPVHQDSREQTISPDVTGNLSVPGQELGESSDMEISEAEEDDGDAGSGSQAMEIEEDVSTTRTGSMSSLGQPVSGSRYPFNFRQPGASGSQHNRRGSRSTTRTPHSKSSSTNHTRSAPSSKFSPASRPNSGSQHTPGSNRNSTPSNRYSSPSNRDSAGSPYSPTSPTSPLSAGMISPPPRHPAASTPGEDRRRRRAGTDPSSPTSPIPAPPPARTRTRTMSATPADVDQTFGPGPSPLYEMSGRNSLEDDEGQDNRSLESSGSNDGEKADSVGLLSNAPSRQSSFGALRHRTSGISLHRRSRPSSVAGSIVAGSGSSGHASRSASASPGSIRSRAMSLLAQRRARADSHHSHHSQQSLASSRSRASSMLSQGASAPMGGSLSPGVHHHHPRAMHSDTRLALDPIASSAEHTFGYNVDWEVADPSLPPAEPRPVPEGRSTVRPISISIPRDTRIPQRGTQPDLSAAPSSFITLPASIQESTTDSAGGHSERSVATWNIPGYSATHEGGNFRPK